MLRPSDHTPAVQWRPELPRLDTGPDLGGVASYLERDKIAIVQIRRDRGEHGPGGCARLSTRTWPSRWTRTAAQRAGVLVTPPIWVGDSSTTPGSRHDIGTPETLTLLLRDR